MPMSREEKEKVLSGFYLDGKEVQVWRSIPGTWSAGIKLSGPIELIWDFENITYRLKPEPVAGWFVPMTDGTFVPISKGNIVSYNPNKAIYLRECDPPEGE